MTPGLQQRHFDYVLGPNQDARLASVTVGTTIEGIPLQMDTDAPFVLTSRAVRCAYTTALPNQNALTGLRTRWSGPERDYRGSRGRPSFVLETLQSSYFGQFGNPKPIVPGIVYPPGSVLMLDLKHQPVSPYGQTITNLTFFFRGYKLYPPGAVPAYKYPKRMASLPFAYPLFVSQLGTDETRLSQLFTVKPDADFVLRGGQSFFPDAAGVKLANVSMILRDFNKQAYSNDFVPLDVLFGSSSTGSAILLGVSASIQPFGTGPAAPGLFYPEIYIPANHQMLYDIQRSDGALAGATLPADFTMTLLGEKVYPR